MCESGFTVRRDGMGFTGAYDFTSSKLCGEVHAPRVLYDDLTLQPSGPCDLADKPAVRVTWLTSVQSVRYGLCACHQKFD